MRKQCRRESIKDPRIHPARRGDIPIRPGFETTDRIPPRSRKRDPVPVPEQESPVGARNIPQGQVRPSHGEPIVQPCEPGERASSAGDC